jgi:hypothetical protein
VKVLGYFEQCIMFYDNFFMQIDCFESAESKSAYIFELSLSYRGIYFRFFNSVRNSAKFFGTKNFFLNKNSLKLNQMSYES